MTPAWVGKLHFRLTVMAQVDAMIQDGRRCCLLRHRHDETLSDIASITIFGPAVRDAGELHLRVDRKPILSGVGPEEDFEAVLRTYAENQANYLRRADRPYARASGSSGGRSGIGGVRISSTTAIVQAIKVAPTINAFAMPWAMTAGRPLLRKPASRRVAS